VRLRGRTRHWPCGISHNRVQLGLHRGAEMDWVPLGTIHVQLTDVRPTSTRPLLGKYRLCWLGERDLALSELFFLVNEFHPVLAGSLFELPFQSRVVVVLDMVVGAAGEALRDFRPAVAEDFVQLKNFLVFL